MTPPEAVEEDGVGPALAGDEASRVPPTSTVPASMPARSVILPSRVPTERASMMPLLFTTLASSASFAPAVMITWPPSAWINCRFCARSFKVLRSTARWISRLPSNVSVSALPAPKATVPRRAAITPWFDTWLPINAT